MWVLCQSTRSVDPSNLKIEAKNNIYIYIYIYTHTCVCVNETVLGTKFKTIVSRCTNISIILLGFVWIQLILLKIEN